MPMVATKAPYTLLIVDDAVMGKVESNLPCNHEEKENQQEQEDERGI